MNTAILSALFLSSFLVPTWHGNYSQAQREAANQKKPLVVVFGSGADGWSKIISDRSPDEQVSKLLLNEYVCVYVNTDSPDGKRLAENFDLPGKAGLVISDRTLSTQAFWHQGDMTHDRAVHYLQKYANAGVIVRGTETTTTVRMSYYPSQATSVPTRTISSANC